MCYVAICIVYTWEIYYNKRIGIYARIFYYILFVYTPSGHRYYNIRAHGVFAHTNYDI